MVAHRTVGFGAFALGVLSLGMGVAPRHSAAAAPALVHLPAASLASMAVRVLPPPPPKPGRFAASIDVSTFQRGNIHTHTRWSDGDSPPAAVISWYRQHGYQWIAITDHNTLTDPKLFRPLEKKGKFVILPGEEITMRGAGKQVHVNALCEKSTIGGHTTDTQAGALAWAIARVHDQGGVALVNHPNWDWAFGLEALGAAKGAELLEIKSGHPFVHEEGDETHPSHEKLWDDALAAGLDFAGAAVDDAHTFGATRSKKAALPGRGWIEAFATEARADLVCDALRTGRLYSSSGPKLDRIVVEGGAFTVWSKAPGAVVEFVGKGGEVLQKGPPGSDGARYELVGGEAYVRARVTDGKGKQAWTNAYRVTPASAPG